MIRDGTDRGATRSVARRDPVPRALGPSDLLAADSPTASSPSNALDIAYVGPIDQRSAGRQNRPRRRAADAGARQRALPPRAHGDARLSRGPRLSSLDSSPDQRAPRGPRPRRAARLGALRNRGGNSRGDHVVRRHVRVGRRHAGNARSGRARHHVSGSVRSRSVTMRRVDGRAPGERVGALRYLETPLVRVGVSPHAPYTVSDDLFRAAAELAREQRLPIAVHIAESELEHELIADGAGAFADGLRRRGIPVSTRASSPIQLLATTRRARACRPCSFIVFVSTHDDIEAIAASQVDRWRTVRRRTRSSDTASRPLDELLAAGITVGLGSDSMASNNRMDMLDEARLALLRATRALRIIRNSFAERRAGVGDADGARAIGMGDLVGTLEPGKQADLAAFCVRRSRPGLRSGRGSGVRARWCTSALRCGRRKALLRTETAGARAGLQDRVEAFADALAKWLANARRNAGRCGWRPIDSVSCRPCDSSIA